MFLSFSKFLRKKKNYFYTKNYLEKWIAKGQVTVGEHTYGKVTLIGDMSNLVIGNYCSIADKCIIFLGHNHRVDWVSTYPFNAIDVWKAGQISGHPATKGDVVIGHDVWLGYNATILSGVTIGNGAVVGAMSVVTKSVPPYAIVAGNPAKIIRYRFTEGVIKKLQTIAWWDWPHEKVMEAIPHLQHSDIGQFVALFGSLDSCQPVHPGT